MWIEMYMEIGWMLDEINNNQWMMGNGWISSQKSKKEIILHMKWKKKLWMFETKFIHIFA
jgi:hypothetical protein